MSVPNARDHYDVVVAGARCAGASTAMLLARMGARVLLVDPLPPGRDTLSTHALMRVGVLQLHRWGLLDAVKAAGTPPIRSVTFDYEDEKITIPIKPKKGMDALFAPRRTVLDPILVEGAEEAGVHVIHGLAVSELKIDTGGRVRGARMEGRSRDPLDVSTDLVVGADGINSKVARLAGAGIEHLSDFSTAVIYGYWTGLPQEEYRWIFRRGAGLGVIPTNQGETCIFAAMSPERFASGREHGLEVLFNQVLLEHEPELATQLSAHTRPGPLRGFQGRKGFLRRAAGPGWALVGDAGFFRDPLTAHGMTDAFRDAELLARAVASGREEGLELYQKKRDDSALDLFRITNSIASLAWSMEEIKELHHALNKAMNSGIGVIETFDASDEDEPGWSQVPGESGGERSLTAS